MTTIRIEQDDNPESPREWDNVGTMIAFHKRYNLGDKDHGYKSEDYHSWAEMEQAIRKDNPRGVILPVYMYDHSGITIATTPFSCQWDSGQIGFIVASVEKIRECFMVKRITAKTRNRVHEVLTGEVETYDQFLRGDVYYFAVEDDAGNVTESCGGFYGSDPMTNGMAEHLDESLHELLREAAP